MKNNQQKTFNAVNSFGTVWQPVPIKRIVMIAGAECYVHRYITRLDDYGIAFGTDWTVSHKSGMQVATASTIKEVIERAHARVKHYADARSITPEAMMAEAVEQNTARLEKLKAKAKVGVLA